MGSTMLQKLPRTAAATQARRDVRDFNHKAIHAMAGAGESILEIVDVLKLSKRTVYEYLAEPCPALASDLAEAAQRMAERKALHDATSFCQREGDAATNKEASTMALRRSIGDMLDGKMRKADVARVLGITPQLLQYHVKRINEPTTADRYTAGCTAYAAAILSVYAWIAMHQPWLRVS